MRPASGRLIVTTPVETELWSTSTPRTGTWHRRTQLDGQHHRITKIEELSRAYQTAFERVIISTCTESTDSSILRRARDGPLSELWLHRRLISISSAGLAVAERTHCTREVTEMLA